ncbi:MAG TPA: flippase activity-associated protein Agl23 [Pyrinomonadaceae bacterium]|nr:flippase activity-associated protein Agl23 [Pyrinomonadaceae bacterium]
MASTSSTKSGSKKARAKIHPAETGAPDRPRTGGMLEDNISERVWQYSAIGIVLIATILRLYDLDLVPLHHDEGVNGNFLVRLVREGMYRYDPENYHGPTLYYFSAVIPWITKLLFGSAARDHYGLTTFTIRLIPALFGIGTIGLVFLLRRKLGTIATLAAALLLAISPGAVYLSRYYIHETLFVFFTLGIVVACVWFYEKRKPAHLIPAIASAALLFATKETAMISVGVLIIALGLTLVYAWFNRKTSVSSAPKRSKSRAPTSRFRQIINEMGGTPVVVGNLVVALIVSVALYLLFYSSFFRNPQGISDSLQTFAVWSKTGKTAHVHPPSMYVIWLFYQEGPLLFLGAVGAVFAVLKPKNSLALFCALWAFGLIAAYSLIPYKTPWLVLNFIIPLALIGGYAVQAIYEMDRGQLRLVSTIMVVAAGVGIFQTINLNFINYDNDDPKYVYVYAHTTRPTLALVNEIEQIAKQESGDLTGISVVSPDYWPLPWYLRNFTRVGYFGRMAPSNEPLIIANESQKTEIEANFGNTYEQVQSTAPGGSFELRPGVKLLLYRRRT